MAPALFDITTVDIDGQALRRAASDAPYIFRATGSVIKFPGFLAVYTRGPRRRRGRRAGRQPLPPLTEGELLDLLRAAARAALHPAAAALHRGDAGQGARGAGDRPPEHLRADARDAPGARLRRARRRRCIPTELGLRRQRPAGRALPAISSTSASPPSWRDELDEIAAGERAWVPMLQEFYGPFAETLEKAEQIDRAGQAQGRADRRGLREVRPADGDQAGPVRQVPGLQRLPGVPQRASLLTTIGVTCPKCHEGEIVERRTKGGASSTAAAATRTATFSRMEQAGRTRRAALASAANPCHEPRSTGRRSDQVPDFVGGEHYRHATHGCRRFARYTCIGP